MAPLRQMNDSGAVHMLEAILATVLLLYVRAYMNANIHAPASGENDAHGSLSGDILNALMYRNNTVEDPGLAHVMSSQKEWDKDSASMGTAIEGMLPDGMHYYVLSRYGELGDKPPSYVNAYARPFTVYCEDDEKMEECEMVLWR